MKVTTINKKCERVEIEKIGRLVAQYNDLLLWDEKGNRTYSMYDYKDRYVIDVTGKMKITTINRECERVEIKEVSRMLLQHNELILWDEKGNRTYSMYDYINRYVIDVTNEE